MNNKKSRTITFMFLAVIIAMFTSCSENLSSEKVITEYGDEFRIVCDLQHKWYVEDIGKNRIRVQGENPKLIGVWNDNGMKCYFVFPNSIIYKTKSMPSFELFDQNLEASPFMIPCIKQNLLRSSSILRSYIHYFVNSNDFEVIAALEKLAKEEYEELGLYNITKDEYELTRLTDIALNTLP